MYITDHLCCQMPQLKPEDTTMIGLTLFNQLCQLARIANTSLDNPLSDEQVHHACHHWYCVALCMLCNLCPSLDENCEVT